MNPKFRALHRRQLARARAAASAAKCCPPGSFLRLLYLDVEAELRAFAGCIERDVRPAPPMPAHELLCVIDRFDFDVIDELKLPRFQAGQRAFGHPPT